MTPEPTPSTQQNGTTHHDRSAASSSTSRKPAKSSKGLPAFHDAIAQLDKIRARLPLGDKVTKAEADVLRAQARGLRTLANQLDNRADELDKLHDAHTGEQKPRVERVPVD